MPNEGAPEREALRAALGPGNDCPPIEQLEALVDHPASALPALAQHVESCTYCKTEVSLLRRFQSGDLDEPEQEPVRQITERLRAQPVTVSRQPWWKTIWTVRWLSPAALAMAAVLIFLAVGLQWRTSQPGLHAPTGQEVLRSNAISVIAPSGDLQQIPNEIRWQSAAAAVRYEVRLMEVDYTNLWKADTVETRIELPSQVRAQILPAKTLLCQVTAFDGSGHIVAESNIVRFRLLQNVYTP
jgi:hypothetical protein